MLKLTGLFRSNKEFVIIITQMEMEKLGYKNYFDSYLSKHGLSKSDIGRVSAVHRNRYIVLTESAELTANLTGNLQFSVSNQSELPAVGDWVVLQKFDDSMALITEVLPRYSQLERKTVGKVFDKQIIAANIDYGLIVDAVGENFKINRIERYIAICNTYNIKPMVIITKIDLIDDREINSTITDLKNRIENVEILPISNKSRDGVDQIKSILQSGETYCLLGLSGVGKSTLINNLLDKEVLRTKAISDSTQKGVHTTTHREMFILDNGSIIIDNPGMREVGLTDSSDNLDITFDKITEIGRECLFSDCTHIHEKDCAVLLAVENGELDKSQYENFVKMIKEQSHFQASAIDRKRKDKSFGKMVKNFKKEKVIHKRN